MSRCTVTTFDQLQFRRKSDVTQLGLDLVRKIDKKMRESEFHPDLPELQRDLLHLVNMYFKPLPGETKIPVLDATSNRDYLT